jgi:hypothetical protein
MTARPALLPIRPPDAVVIDFITAAKVKRESHSPISTYMACRAGVVIPGAPWWWHRFLGGPVWWKDRFYFLPPHEAISEVDDDDIVA